MHNFQHLEDLFRQAQGESSLSRLAPGDALTDAVHDYFRHYGLEALLNDTSGACWFVDTGRFAVGPSVEPPRPQRLCHSWLFRSFGPVPPPAQLPAGQRLARGAVGFAGHGLSGNPGQVGTPMTAALLAHLQETLQTLGMAPEPWLGVGQSTGAAILATDALTRRDTAGWAGIVLLAPLVRPWRWSQASWLHLIASPFVKELPRKYRPNSTDEAFTAFLRDQDPLQPERLSVAWITCAVGCRAC